MQSNSLWTRIISRLPVLRIRQSTREAGWGYIFVLPWIIGFIAFSAGPILAAFYFSFTRYSIFKPPVWIGFDNYIKLFTDDPLFWKSLYNTIYFVALAVPGKIILSLFLAILLNAKIGLRSVYRTLLYLPMIVPAVSSALIFAWILDANLGIVKYLLAAVGLPSPLWFASEDWSKLGIVILAMWHIGGDMVIFLAGLQGVPTHLYEAAEIDGATWLQKMQSVTLPMLSSTIFFVLVNELINNFQVFSFAYIMTRGGPLNSTLFYVLYLYRAAFGNFEMGYASALASVLFVIIFAASALVFRTARNWVYYEA
jgi:multiple sugar transport system permease protein